MSPQTAVLDAPTHATREAVLPLARFLVPLGRALFSLIFLGTLASHFSAGAIGYAAQQGLPLAQLLVPASGVLAAAGGLSILLGYRARLGAVLVVAFLIPVTLVMHRFWGLADPMQAQLQMAMFLKNVSLVGGALLIAYWGSGPASLDSRTGR